MRANPETDECTLEKLKTIQKFKQTFEIEISPPMDQNFVRKKASCQKKNC